MPAMARCWILLALVVPLGNATWTAGSNVARPESIPWVPPVLAGALGRLRAPSFDLHQRTESFSQSCADAPAPRRQHRQPPLAAVGVSPPAGAVEMVSLRGHEIPLHLRGVLSGFAGGLAGSSVSFLLHPLDTLKTMKQAKSGKNFGGFIEAGAAAIKSKGLYNGLYAGARTAAAGSFLSSALYFGTYESMKELWAAALPPLSQPLAPSLAAISGNAASSLIFVPKEVLKQRCQIGQLANGQKAIGLMRDIVRTEGIGAMYNGYFATLLRNAPGAMLKFGIYEQIKTVLVSLRQRPLQSHELFGAGVTAGCISSFATTPLDVVKTRMMLGQMPSQSPLKAIIKIARDEGVRSLWSGFVPRLIWSATFFAVGISTYETVLARILNTVVDGSSSTQRRVGPGGVETESVRNPIQASADMIQNFYASSIGAHVMATR